MEHQPKEQLAKKKIYKCDYGYLNKQVNTQLIKTLILFGISFGILFIGIHISGNRYNYFTIIAVLGMLPAAKELISYIMFLRAKKYACPEALHEEILNETGDDDFLWTRYDLYMTSYQKCFPIYAMACKDNTLIGFSDVKDFDYEKAQEHINLLLMQNGHKSVIVKVFSDKKKFLGRLNDFKEAGLPVTEKEREILHLMENLSL